MTCVTSNAAATSRTPRWASSAPASLRGSYPPDILGAVTTFADHRSPDPAFDPSVAARAHRAIEPLHAFSYFAPEMEEELTAVGLERGRMTYFASRSAAMGAVTSGTTTATFFNFNPDLVARHLPRAWTLATPEQVLAARLTAVDRALARLLGSEALGSSELAELAALARTATEGLDPAGRTLFAAHADLGWPDEPHLVLWHAATLLREYRGDGHLAALLGAGLSGIGAIVTHTATGRGFTVGWARRLRGWSEDEWAAAVSELQAAGLLDEDGLTASGRELRQSIEDATDRLASAPWVGLGADRTARLVELGKGLSRIAVGNGAFPDGVFATAR